MEGDFSQRMGIIPLTKTIQVDSIDADLNHSLWNVIVTSWISRYYHRDKLDKVSGSNSEEIAILMYKDFYKVPIDGMPYKWSAFKAGIRESYFKMSWHRTYNFIEFFVSLDWRNSAESAVIEFNKVLERENSAYRFVDRKLMQITSPEEIAEIESAITNGIPYAGVKPHLQTALAFITNRDNPDYRNSIKESISAVEALCRNLTGDAAVTLGQALKVLEKKHALHPALKTAFQSLYGYTNDADGIRHSLIDDGRKLTNADARFMLITCSAFINFAIDSTKE